MLRLCKEKKNIDLLPVYIAHRRSEARGYVKSEQTSRATTSFMLRHDIVVAQKTRALLACNALPRRLIALVFEGLEC